VSLCIGTTIESLYNFIILNKSLNNANSEREHAGHAKSKLREIRTLDIFGRSCAMQRKKREKEKERNARTARSSGGVQPVGGATWVGRGGERVREIAKNVERPGRQLPIELFYFKTTSLLLLF
jgi:hypothetical protein